MKYEDQCHPSTVVRRNESVKARTRGLIIRHSDLDHGDLDHGDLDHGDSDDGDSHGGDSDDGDLDHGLLQATELRTLQALGRKRVWRGQLLRITLNLVSEPTPPPTADLATPALPGLSELPHPSTLGFTVRPLRREEVAAAYELYATCEEDAIGVREVSQEDIESDWDRPSFDLATESIGIFDGEHLVAAAEVFKAWRADGCVLPAYRRRGLGTWLAAWSRDTARAAGGTKVGQTVPADTDPERFYQGLGYEVRHTSWVLELPEGQTIAAQPIPEGFTIRDYTDQDAEGVYRLVNDAFNEWPDRVETSFGDWAAGSIGRADFEPWHLRLMISPSRELVGSCYLILQDDTGYVQQLATRADHRGLGLARALLVDAFERSRAHGMPKQELSTDSRTGALGLYEKVGMRVRATWRNWATPL